MTQITTNHSRKEFENNETDQGTPVRHEWNTRFKTAAAKARFMDKLDDYQHALKKRDLKTTKPEALEWALDVALKALADRPIAIADPTETA